MQRQNANRSGVREDCDPTAPIRVNRFIQFSGSAVERLPETLASKKNVFLVSLQQRCILLRMLLGGLFKS